jgi:hypothetical protein
MNVTLRQYYKAFGSLYGVLAGIPFVPVLLHLVAPDSNKLIEYLYPPLGDVLPLALPLTLISGVLVTLEVWLVRRHARRVRPSIPVILKSVILLGSLALIFLYVSYVRNISVPSAGLNVTVSVGYQRTDFALKTYPDWNDRAMLHDHGPWEESIQVLWTRNSIWVVRGALWLAYTLTLVCILAVVCLGVYQHALEGHSGESKGSERGQRAKGESPSSNDAGTAKSTRTRST